MTTITLSSPEFYNGGKGGASALVGVTYGANRVVRYSFTAPTIGATGVSLSFSKVYPWSEGTPQNKLYFYIGTDPDSYKNAGNSYVDTGVLEYVKKSDGFGYFEGTAEVLLLPNTIYYLFVFPTWTTNGSWQWQTSASFATMTSSGGAGLVYIDNGSGFDAYQIYIDNGTGWDLHMPYIDNGSGWDLYT